MAREPAGSVTPMDLRAHLRSEFERRRARNPRYSLRAFAKQLGTSHSTLSRVLNSDSRLTSRSISTLGSGLGLSSRAISGSVLNENMRRIEALTDRAQFRADARWIASQTGLPIDDVNVALHYLIHSKRLVMSSTTKWLKTQVP
jgi:transcriptional regulator with XRE-family HTH domain